MIADVFVTVFYSGPVQPQSVGAPRDTAEGHGKGRPNGVKLPQKGRDAVKRLQDAGGTVDTRHPGNG